MKYNIIYADPPWDYDQKEVRGAATNHYPTMKLDDLKAMRPYIDEIADKNCALFMWYTFPQQREAMELVEAWDFWYRTCAFVWVKETQNGRIFIGNGNYTRSNVECCMLAKRGKVTVIRHNISQVVKTIISKEKYEHSKKPPIIRQRIVDLLGDLPRIELFARKRAHGWDSYGNDAELSAPTLDSYFGETSEEGKDA